MSRQFTKSAVALSALTCTVLSMSVLKMHATRILTALFMLSALTSTASADTYKKFDPSVNWKARAAIISKKALADPTFMAALSKGDANSAKMILVGYGAPPDVVVRVQRPGTFVVSTNSNGIVDQRLPMRCTQWEPLGYLAEVPGGSGQLGFYVYDMMCLAYEIDRRSGL
jgi:hypothetical protein